MRALRTIINALLKALPMVAQAFLIMMLCGACVRMHAGVEEVVLNERETIEKEGGDGVKLKRDNGERGG
jgi:hypothetical protein